MQTQSLASGIGNLTQAQVCGRAARTCTSLFVGRGSNCDSKSGTFCPAQLHAGFGLYSQLFEAQWVESLLTNRTCMGVRVRVVCVLNKAGRFRSLYGEYQPDVLAYFLRRLSRDDAVDATAEVFLTAWRRIEDVPSSSEARLWMFGVARNVLRNQQRSLRRRGRLWAKLSITKAESEPLPETVVMRREEDREVIAALDRLRPQDREVLTLRLWEEASFDDIAAFIGCSRHAAEQRYGRALRRLRSGTHRSGHVDMSGKSPALPTKEPTQ
jgi:RNA polymerase sigma-70 factor (ECF subfamily)